MRFNPILDRYAQRRDSRLHSREHVLADDLSRMLEEPKRFAAYLGIAKLYYESDLRALARYVVEKTDLPREARGKYFFAALKGLAKRFRAVEKKKHGKQKYRKKAGNRNRTRARFEKKSARPADR